MKISSSNPVLRSVVSCTVLAMALTSGPLAWAKDPSQGSKTLASGAALSAASVHRLSAEGKPVEASMVMALAGGVVVAGIIQSAADGVKLSVTSMVDGSKWVLKLSQEAFRAAAVSVGTVIRVSAEASGHVLVVSGKVLAFVPNALGQALLHQSKL